MILDKIEDLIKHPNFAHKNLLRLVKGEFQTIEARQNKALSNEEQVKVIKKLIKSNEETISLMSAYDYRRLKLGEENILLKSLLPPELSKSEIKSVLGELDLKSYPKEGQAFGLAFKRLKELSISCDSSVVQEVVREIRSE